MKIPNLLIDGMTRLSLTECKLFFLSFFKARDASAEIEIKKIVPSLGGSQYSQIQKAIKSLMKKIIVCQDGDEKIFLHLIESARHNQENISVRSSPDLLKVVSKSFKKFSPGYTKVQPQSILKLRSFYSVMLYLNAAKNVRFAEFKTTLPELKKLFNVSDKYDRQRDFLKKLNAAIEEVNEKTEIKITYEKKTYGQKILYFYFRLAVRIDKIDLRDILDEKTAAQIIETYPGDYIKKCIVITEKNHRPERGTKSGYFLKIIKNGYEKFLLQRNRNISFMAARIKTKIDTPAPRSAAPKISRAQYEKLPPYAKKLINQFKQGFSDE